MVWARLLCRCGKEGIFFRESRRFLEGGYALRRVATDMGTQGLDLMKSETKPTWTSQQSVEHQLKLLDGLTLDKSGGYFQHTGEAIPW